MRVCLFGAYDPAYPRHRILAAGLARVGVEVVEARVRETRAFRRWPALARAFGRAARTADVVLVPEFRHKDVPLARALAGRRGLVFDPLVSRWDTLVHDWALHAEGSAQARWNRALDRVALRLPDRVLCDTTAHGALFARLGARPPDLRRVVVGAEDAFFDVPAPAPAREVRLLYVGGFLPLHGALTLIDAAARLEALGAAVPPWRMTLAGSGIEHERARARVAALALARVELPGPVPYADLPARIAAADVVLGAFGASAKAGRVVPHKVWQGLAAGRAVVTGDGDGPRELLEDRVHARLVPRADAAALADALAEVVADGGARARLAAAGRAHAEAIARPARIGATLRAVLEEVAP